MSLRDVLIGMQNGPRGAPAASGGGGGMSPIVMALLGLLAYKAIKGRGQNTSGPVPQQAPPLAPGANEGGLGGLLGGLFGGGAAGANAPAGGGWNDLLRGGLGSLLGGAAAGSVLSGGLGTLIKDLQNSGQGRAAQSWVGTGPNEQIAPNELGKALGSDTVDALTRQTGMGRDALLQALSHYLPEFVDRLTPNGRLPTEQEASEMA